MKKYCILIYILLMMLVHTFSAYAMDINETYGIYTEKYTEGRPNLPAIYIIEDAHCHPDVQHNIVALLKEFIDSSQNQIVVGIEGAYYGPVATDALKIFDEEKSKFIFAEMIESGTLSAAEYVHAKDGEFILYGLEDDALYKSNVEKYQEYINAKKVQETDIEHISETLESLKVLLLPPEYLIFENAEAKYYKEGSDDFLKQLLNYVDLYEIAVAANGAFEKMIMVKKEMHKIDERKLTIDINVICQKYDIEFDMRSAGDTVMTAYGKIIKEYTEVYKYFLLKKQLEMLSSASLMHEIKEIVIKIKYELAAREDQRELLEYIELFKEVKQFLNLKLKPEKYLKNKALFTAKSMSSIESYVRSFQPEFSLGGNYKKICEDRINFYEDARERDIKMTGNVVRMISDLGLDSEHTLIMIIGGFHTAGITNELRNKNISYAVIRPRLGSGLDVDNEAYFTVLKESTAILAGK